MKNPSISTSIIELRAQRGWTQERLAQVSGIGLRTVQRLERPGSHENKKETLQAIAAAFDVDVARLRSGHDRESIEAMLSDYSCRICGAPLSVRTSVSTECDDVEQDVFACGAMEGYTRRPCPDDPKFPKFEDYEVHYFEDDGEWHCLASGRTEEARQVRLRGYPAPSKEKALERLKRSYVEEKHGHAEAERQFPFASFFAD